MTFEHTKANLISESHSKKWEKTAIFLDLYVGDFAIN
jgi:hypothetical protein